MVHYLFISKVFQDSLLLWDSAKPKSEMVATRIRKNSEKAALSGNPVSQYAPLQRLDDFDPDLVELMRNIAVSGLNPSSALDLLARLIAEVPAASKETVDRIKTMDKLINTARSMMETKLKNEEAAAITQRLDDLELLVRRVATEPSGLAASSVELWNKPQQNG